MDTSTIGIKIADGSYFPVLEESAEGAKRLVLTTVKDNQRSVQIDFYRGGDEGAPAEEANYLGSLLVEDVTAGEQGTPEIELKMQLDMEGNFHAEAVESENGERQSLSLNLVALEAGENYEIPDFDLEEDLPGETSDFSVASDLENLEEDILGDREDFIEEDSGKNRTHPLLLVGFVILGLAAVFLLALLLFRLFQGPPVPPLEAKSDVPVEIVQETEPAAAETDSPEAADTGGSPNNKSSTVEKAVNAGKTGDKGDDETNGVWYRIRRGDTLWDLSSSFYRTPWLYGKIAKENDIKDPDLIFAGNQLFIPEQ